MNYSEMEYTELQERAKALNFPYHRVAKEDLIKSLEEADAKGIKPEEPASENARKEINDEEDKTEENAPADHVEDAKKEDPALDEPTDETEDEGKKEKKSSKPNTAIVYNGSLAHVIRTYSLEDHGKNFSKLAAEFAGQHEGYEIKETHVTPAQICRNCGHAMVTEE